MLFLNANKLPSGQHVWGFSNQLRLWIFSPPSSKTHRTGSGSFRIDVVILLGIWAISLFYSCHSNSISFTLWSLYITPQMITKCERSLRLHSNTLLPMKIRIWVPCSNSVLVRGSIYIHQVSWASLRWGILLHPRQLLNSHGEPLNGRLLPSLCCPWMWSGDLRHRAMLGVEHLAADMLGGCSRPGRCWHMLTWKWHFVVS